MTEAGWTHGKDLSAEGQSFMASVKVLIDAIEQEAYQQGRVAGLREGAEMVPGIMQHPHGSSKDWCEAQRAICAAIKRRAQQAQEGGVGDANG